VLGPHLPVQRQRLDQRLVARDGRGLAADSARGQVAVDGPDARLDGEAEAALAVTGEREAVDAMPELVDLLRVGGRGPRRLRPELIPS